jgi:hypothetical protein
MHPRKQPPQ